MNPHIARLPGTNLEGQNDFDVPLAALVEPVEGRQFAELAAVIKVQAEIIRNVRSDPGAGACPNEAERGNLDGPCPDPGRRQFSSILLEPNAGPARPIHELVEFLRCKRVRTRS